MKKSQKISETPGNLHFNTNKIIIKDYNFAEDIYNERNFISSYDIYKLNSIKDSFFIAFASVKEKGLLKVCKYNYIVQESEEIYEMQNEKEIQLINHFYDPLSKKDYLFIYRINSLQIYLIKTEKEYKLINDKIYKKNRSFSLKVFYNIFTKKIYLITLFSYNIACFARNNVFEIFEFRENELISIKAFSSEFITFNLNLLYEDKNKNCDYLIINIEDNIKYMPINDELYNYLNYSDIPNFKASDDLNGYYDYGCIIYKNNINDIDILYLFDNSGNISAINILTKELIMKLNIKYDINTILNFNNKYIIIGTKTSLLAFDIEINKIISNYKIVQDNISSLISIKKLEDGKFSFLFVDQTDNIIKMFY